MVWIKICGITRLEDALLAAELGADALGFVFCPSPRRIKLYEASQIINQLPDQIARVGVFLDQPLDEVREISDQCKLDYLQFHGQEEPDYCRLFGRQAIKAVRVSSPQDVEGIERYGTEMVVLDTFVPGKAGGTGQVFPWEWLKAGTVRGLTPEKVTPKIILAGGLNPTNVTEAIKEVQPFGVDVSSGVEVSPGIKDPVKLKALIDQVKKGRVYYELSR